MIFMFLLIFGSVAPGPVAPLGPWPLALGPWALGPWAEGPGVLVLRTGEAQPAGERCAAKAPPRASGRSPSKTKSGFASNKMKEVTVMGTLWEHFRLA